MKRLAPVLIVGLVGAALVMLTLPAGRHGGTAQAAPASDVRDCNQEPPIHENVQTANDQSAPAAVANSLQWLEDKYAIVVPDDNVLGLLGVPPNSLVGQLDLAMGRTARSRADGDPLTDVQVLDGKLKYLSDHGIRLHVKHQDDGSLGGPLPGGGSYTAHGITSLGRGSPTSRFIVDEICRSEDVELAYQESGGNRQWVEVVRAGINILGVDYIYYRYDTSQTNVDLTDTLGTGAISYSTLSDTDADGLPNLDDVAGKPDIDIVLTQSRPGVGGMQDLPDVAGNTDSGGSSLPYAAVAGAAMGLVVIGAGGWYARRRWLS